MKHACSANDGTWIATVAGMLKRVSSVLASSGQPLHHGKPATAQTTTSPSNPLRQGPSRACINLVLDARLLDCLHPRVPSRCCCYFSSLPLRSSDIPFYITNSTLQIHAQASLKDHPPDSTLDRYHVAGSQANFDEKT